MSLATIDSTRSAITPLAAVSIGAVGLLGLRTLCTDHPWNPSLVWNLFLAWIPLGIALGLQRHHEKRSLVAFWSWTAAWLLFFPNAPYLLTDLVHLPSPHRSSWWTELVLHLLFALTGLVAGFLSLRIMQRLVAERHGAFVGVVAAIGFSGLAGLGLYLGRIGRWNSWDVVADPVGLLLDSPNWFQPRSLKLVALFSILVLGAHGLLMALVPATGSKPATRRSRGFSRLP